MTLINTKLHNIELLLAIRQWKVIGMFQFKCSVCQPECRYFYIPAITSLNAPLGIPISLLVQITRNTPKQRLLFVYVCLYQKSMENNASLLFSGWKPPLPPHTTNPAKSRSENNRVDGNSSFWHISTVCTTCWNAGSENIVFCFVHIILINGYDDLTWKQIDWSVFK